MYLFSDITGRIAIKCGTGSRKQVALGLFNLYRSLIPSKGESIFSFGLHTVSCPTDARALFLGVN
jgi:hypothetical protein